MGKFLNSLQQRIEITDKVNYHREQFQTYMTGPEWRNVEMAEEYASFIKEGNSIFQFPYFRQVFDLWKVIYNSYSLARKYNSAWQIITSEYMLMDLFVGFFTTIELIPKGILSLILAPFIKKQNKTEMQGHLASFYQKYASELQTIPFYDHSYKEIRQDLAAKYKQIEHKTWGDWFSWTCISIELLAREWISKPLRYWFHQDTNSAPPSTDILVKYNIDGTIDSEQAKEHFRQQIGQLTTKEAPVTVVPEDIYVKEKSASKSYTSVYARLRVPRYAAFMDVLNGMDKQGIQLRKIAGQERVQIKCEINAQDELSLRDAQEKLTTKARQKPVYSYGDRIHAYRRVCLFDVHVRDLAKNSIEFNGVENAGVTLIHNF